MAAIGNVAFANERLVITGPSLIRSLPKNSIEQIYLCSMEDEIHHGSEHFHFLILTYEFVLIGPFVDGALGAIDALTRANPKIPVSQRLVRTVPYGFRAPGFLGLRLFPVPGLRAGPIHDLKKFNFVSIEDQHV